MDRKTRRVLLGYFNLSDAERDNFNREAEAFRHGDWHRRRDLRESHERTEKMDLGPVGAGCPCCGR